MSVLFADFVAAVRDRHEVVFGNNVLGPLKEGFNTPVSESLMAILPIECRILSVFEASADPAVWIIVAEHCIVVVSASTFAPSEVRVVSEVFRPDDIREVTISTEYKNSYFHKVSCELRLGERKPLSLFEVLPSVRVAALRHLLMAIISLRSREDALRGARTSPGLGLSPTATRDENDTT
jgi:hypothetical protein